MADYSDTFKSGMSKNNPTSKLRKVGALKVKNGTYMKDGVEKNRYNEIGIVFATPHFSRLTVKFHNTQTGEGQWADVFYDDSVKEAMESNRDNRPMTQAQALNGGKDVVLEDIPDEPISLGEIPF